MDEYNNQASESFWEIGKYNRTVKRIENGSKLCDSLRQLIETRSDIEKSYAKQLSQWSRKWTDFLDKGPEYGTTQAAWRSVLTEADKLCELHTEVAEKLMTNVYLQIKQWNKENYHKTMINFRESKDKEDNFKRAQKPWMKRYQKVVLAKKEYHAACKQEKSTANQENNAKGDPSVPVEQVKKLGEKLQKCHVDVESAREKYTTALHDLNGYNPKYIEEMTFVFNECQEMERKRLMFFKQMLFGIHHCLDLSQDHRFAEIYRQFYQQINCADCEKDLRWWSNIYGAGMSMNWPEFEEYSPELHNITKTKKTNFGSNEGIIITGIKHSRDGSYASNTSENTGTTPGTGPNYLSAESSNDHFADSKKSNSTSAPNTTTATTNNTTTNNIITTTTANEVKAADGKNPFGDPDGEDWEEDDTSLVDDNRPGVPVRALYEYYETAADELTFKAGDVFTKLSDADELGWCKGRKDGRVGLYPATYVEPL